MDSIVEHGYVILTNQLKIVKYSKKSYKGSCINSDDIKTTVTIQKIIK